MGTHTPPPEFGDSEPEVQRIDAERVGIDVPRYPSSSPESTPGHGVPGVDHGGTGSQGVPGPLGVFATVRASLGLYRSDALTLWQVMALVIIPLQVLVFLLRIITVPHGAVLDGTEIRVPYGTSTGAYVGASDLGAVLGQLVLLIATGASYRILLGRHLHHPAGLSTSLSFATGRMMSLLWVTLLIFVMILIGFICIIVPGVYLGVAFVLAIPVLMAEDIRGFAATTRSRELVSGHWWHVLGCLIVAGIVAGIGIAAVAILAGPIDKAITPHSVTGFFIVNSALGAIISILLSPFICAVPVVLYVDMLARKNDPQLQRLLA